MVCGLPARPFWERGTSSGWPGAGQGQEKGCFPLVGGIRCFEFPAQHMLLPPEKTDLPHQQERQGGKEGGRRSQRQGHAQGHEIIAEPHGVAAKPVASFGDQDAWRPQGIGGAAAEPLEIAHGPADEQAAGHCGQHASGKPQTWRGQRGKRQQPVCGKPWTDHCSGQQNPVEEGVPELPSPDGAMKERTEGSGHGVPVLMMGEHSTVKKGWQAAACEGLTAWIWEKAFAPLPDSG